MAQIVIPFRIQQYKVSKPEKEVYVRWTQMQADVHEPTVVQDSVYAHAG